MTGSFAIPDRGPGYWRGTFAKHEVTVIPGSWEVTGMRGTGSFDWTVEDLFVPERRVMPHVRRLARQSVGTLAGHHLRDAELFLSGRTTARC